MKAWRNSVWTVQYFLHNLSKAFGQKRKANSLTVLLYISKNGSLIYDGVIKPFYLSLSLKLLFFFIGNYKKAPLNIILSIVSCTNNND